MNPLDHPICFAHPERLTPFSAWHEHIPFAMFVVDLLKPRVIVELGTQYGDSYCAFCQAVRDLNLSTRCYAIDSWEGDPQAGFYGPEVLADLRSHHDHRYGTFSRLIQSTFEDALTHFEDGTIDLLHIDGYHTYDAVRRDFESWLPKMSHHGVILFHDINVHERDFGVWKLWDELTVQHPCFAFMHGHGLGVLAAGRDQPKAFQDLLGASEEDMTKIRRFFFEVGHRLTLQVSVQAQQQTIAASEKRHQVQVREQERLSAQVMERQQALEHERAQFRAEQERLAQQIAERDQVAGQMQGTLAALQQEVNRSQARVSALSAQVMERQQTLEHERAQFRAEQERLAQQIAERDQVAGQMRGTLATLQQEVNRSQARVSALSAQVAAKDQEIYALQHAESYRLGLLLTWPLRKVWRLLLRDDDARAIGADPVITARKPWRMTWSLRKNSPTLGNSSGGLSHTGGANEHPGESGLGFLRPSQTDGAALSSERRPGEGAATWEGITDPPESGSVIEDYELTWRDYRPLSEKIAALRSVRPTNSRPEPPERIEVDETDLIPQARKLRFPAVETPSVSIIIPIYNNEKLTIECLHSILRHTKNVSYEIVVVDDGSAERTWEILSSIEKITCLRNLDNLGFIHSCNRGAEKARGNFLLFLNNDTQVTANWLRPLLQTFSQYENVGAVGPKILYPDGRLQEAGARINRDGSAQLVGLFDDPELPRYNYVREVDYCSGVCLLVQTEQFRALGGFCTDFAPAYCEDVDLCFRLRSQGCRIFYNPSSVIIHYLSATSNQVDGAYKQQCIMRNQQKLSERWQEQIDAFNSVRLIAFYLPQYHPIPENDLWWGKGFTEWTNVAKAGPNFIGHYQPHIPSDLGFYDLRIEEVMEQQAELAKKYGIHGFCFYYYWFGGKRLLELPLERLLSTDQPDIPFCLCWANENWTRKWDGLDRLVLMAQHHSDEDDRAVIRDLMRYMRHPNYIRINGKPLLLVYRISLFPNVKRTVEIWRALCQKEGLGEIYLAMVASFEHASKTLRPSDYGFDAAVEFPPHESYAPVALPNRVLNPNFKGTISDYREIVLQYLRKEIPGHTYFRAVMPSWDNTARRPNDPDFFLHATPGAYQAWLEAIIQFTLEQNFGEERMVFISAWNEWAEGNHLEPDQRFGHGFLEATRNALDQALLRRANAEGL